MKPQSNEKQLLSRAEVAEIFQVSAATVGRWTHDGKLPYRMTLGGQHRYPREEVERLWNQGLYYDEGGTTMPGTTNEVEPEAERQTTGLLSVLERASTDAEFQAQLSDDPEMALAPYALGKMEKAAIASGDVKWIQDKFGKLDDSLVTWLSLRQQQEHEHHDVFRVEPNGLMDVLARAADDEGFLMSLAENPAAALKDYDLNQNERAALASGDIRWIESHYGPLDSKLGTWLTLRMQQERW